MGDNELDDATRGMRDNLWTDSLWQTYQESIDIIVPDPDSPDGPGSRITRKLSIGMSVKSDNRAPAKVLQYALSKALNSIMEEEKERWLDTHTMKTVEFLLIRKLTPKGQTQTVVSFDEYSSSPQDMKIKKAIYVTAVEKWGANNVRYCKVVPVELKIDVSIG